MQGCRQAGGEVRVDAVGKRAEHPSPGTRVNGAGLNVQEEWVLPQCPVAGGPSSAEPQGDGIGVPTCPLQQRMFRSVLPDTSHAKHLECGPELYLLAGDLHLKSHTWPVATVLASTGLMSVKEEIMVKGQVQ